MGNLHIGYIVLLKESLHEDADESYEIMAAIERVSGVRIVEPVLAPLDDDDAPS